MTHSYNIKGMSCTHCVARVEKALTAHPEVSKAEVSLDPPQAVVTMNKHISTEELQDLVKKAGHYQLEGS